MPVVNPVGVVRSPWPDRFGIPRQPGLAPAAMATIELNRDVPPVALRGLEGFSHVWVLFLFHGVAEFPGVADASNGVSAAGTPGPAVRRWTVRPPRLGGVRRLGVYATRSPHRPNGIGMSVVELVEVDATARRLLVRGHDLMDGTPVLDLKPYLPYADAIPDARAGWASDPIPRLDVTYAPAAASFLAENPGLEALITETFALDPRPAASRWGDLVVRIGAVDVRAHVEGGACEVTEIWTWRAP